MSIVLKFGGVCFATLDNTIAAVNRIFKTAKKQHPTIVVVSAPGQANASDTKVTDHLIALHAKIDNKQEFNDIWQLIANKYTVIANYYQLSDFATKLLNHTKKQILAVQQYDFTLSRGEFMLAKLFAKILHATCLDAKFLFAIQKNGMVNMQQTKQQLTKIFTHNLANIVVVPGFYGASENGNIVTFTRDGSDYTASLLAGLLSLKHFKNIKDVKGLMSVSPGIMKNPKQVKQISLRQMRVLTTHGAKLLHPNTVLPLENSNTKLEICHLLHPHHKGTFVVTHTPKNRNAFVSMTGKTNLTLSTVTKQEPLTQQLSTVLSELQQNSIYVLHIFSQTDQWFLVTTTPCGITHTEVKHQTGVSQITLVGCNHSRKTLARILKTLNKKELPFLQLWTGENASTIHILVPDQFYKQTIYHLYNCFYKKPFGKFKLV